MSFRTKIKPYLENIANSTSFIPETARRLASPSFITDLNINEWDLDEFVNEQQSFLLDVIKRLDSDNLASLALVYMNSDKLTSPIELKDHELKSIERLNSSLGGCTSALQFLNGTFVQYTVTDQNSYWRFKHPTIGDAFSKYIVQSPELIEIYLQGTGTEKLLQQVTCGDVGLTNAIIIPKRFFPLIFERLNNFSATKEHKTAFMAQWYAKRQLHQFLSRRCSIDFLAEYVDKFPKILDAAASPGLSLDISTEVDLAYTLFTNKLLPEKHRLQFAVTVSNYAIEGQDTYALKSEEIKSILTEIEYLELQSRVIKELVPQMGKLLPTLIHDYREGDDPEDHVRTLIEVLESVKDEFPEHPEVTATVKGELTKVNDWVEQNTVEKRVKPDRPKLSEVSTISAGDIERSIFDDIDS